ncbi:phage tail protein [Pseudoalteromonas sp. MMG013]|uniref:phage tail protein n=1 Tax=Pseudoalteromonas sp. MMG013 TaxID=2822687 RepID=UPI001B394F49|nr:phage tail protein [Pseudoalteromonas sp. MMG013]MBQ4864477.1 phage tail protein [Pseudoalteromonas sp. MMG013]
MSNSQYWTILTRAGREKVLAAIANKHTVKISEFAVGDGQISHTSNDLINRQYRSHTSALKQLTHNNALIEVVGIVPATEGGFYVREAAFYTDDGEAFAIINYPETYKPAAADNAAAELGIKAVIDVINAQVVSEKIDPSMIYATKEWVSDQVDHSELSVLTQVGKNWTFDNGTSTTVNINADSTGMATLNVCSLDGVENEQTTGRVYVGQSLRHGGGIEYNGDNNPVTTGAGADHISFFRSDGSGLHWTARNYVHSNDWEFRGAVKSPNFIEGGTSLKDKYHGKSDKLARFESSLIDATVHDFKIRSKRALVGFEDRLVINYDSDWSRVDAGGTWRFSGNIERNSHNSGYLVGSHNNIGPNERKTNPIYTIGSNYQPSETELNNMYGIGYTHANASFVPYEGGWGMYVAANGVANIFLDASHGRVHTKSDVLEAGTKLSDKYLGKAAKAVDSSKLNGAVDAAEPTGNTVAKRNATGDLQARLLRATYPNQTTMSGAIAFRVNNHADNYTRYCSNPTAIADWLKSPLDSHYLGKTAKAVDTAKLEGKTKAQVLSEARNGLAQVNTSPLFKNATFDNGTSTTVTISADSAGLAALNVCSGTNDGAQATGRVYVGQSLNHGGGIEYNGDNNPVTTGAGVDYVTLFRKSEGQLHWTARNLHSNNDWEFRGAVKSPNFIEGGTSLKDKYHGKSDKLARFESSVIDTSGPHDLTIRGKRALVGFDDKLVVNYANDWQSAEAHGNWLFTGHVEVKGDLKMSGSDSYIWTPNTENGYTGIYDAFNNKVALKYTNGQRFDYGADITITKNNPWLTLDSASSGSDTNEQAAGISVGESGRDTNGASLHLSYIGNGYSYIGMGNLGPDNVANNWAMKMHYQNSWVMFRSAVLIGDGNTNLSKGAGNSLKIKNNHGYVDIGSENTGHCHYSTDRPSHYFNRKLQVNGEIYAGSNYNKRVYHEGHTPSASDVGAFQRHYGRTPTVVKDNFTTIAKIEGYGLSSSINLQLKGTSGGTVVNVNATILVNHHQDIVIDSLSGGYTAIQLKLISNGNEKYLIQAKLLSGNPLYLHCDILSYTNDGVSIGNYDTADYTVEHTHTVKLFGRNLSSSGATGMQINGHDVAHVGNIAEQSERRIVKSSGILTVNSKNHLIATATFVLPDVSNLEEGTTVVASKAMAVSPTIQTHGVQNGNTEHIAMMRGTIMLTDTSVLFDRHCTLTFILNSEKNWEMQ